MCFNAELAENTEEMAAAPFAIFASSAFQFF